MCCGKRGGSFVLGRLIGIQIAGSSDVVTCARTRVHYRVESADVPISAK